MARKKKVAQPKYTTATAIAKIKSTNLRDMTLDELKAVGRPLMKTVRMRLRRLEDAGYKYSPAYRGYVEVLGMKASVAGKNRNKIMHEVYEAFNFLENANTSSVRGVKQYMARMTEILEFTPSPEQIESIFDIYHRLEKENPTAFMNYGYDQILKRVSRTARATEFDIDEAIMRIRSQLESTDHDETGTTIEWKKENVSDDDWNDVWGNGKSKL